MVLKGTRRKSYSPKNPLIDSYKIRKAKEKKLLRERSKIAVAKDKALQNVGVYLRSKLFDFWNEYQQLHTFIYFLLSHTIKYR